MLSTLAMCLSLHTSGPVATLAQMSAPSLAGDTITIAAKKPGTTKPKTGGGGKADPKKKPPIRTPPGVRGPGPGGGGPM